MRLKQHKNQSRKKNGNMQALLPMPKTANKACHIFSFEPRSTALNNTWGIP